MKRLSFILLSFLFFLPQILAQDTVYYYSSGFEISNTPENAVFKRDVRKKSNHRMIMRTYQMKDDQWQQMKKEKIRILSDTSLMIKSSTDQLLPQKTVRYFSKQPNGLYKFSEYRNGILYRDGSASHIVPMHLQDTVTVYYETRFPKSRGIYKNNFLLGNRNWLKNRQPYVDNIYQFIDQIPEYSMGPVFFRKYILQGLKDSNIDISQITDRVVLGWVITAEGESTGFVVLEGVFKPLNETLVQLIHDLPGEWVPATVKGKPVNYFMTMPFNFLDRTTNFETLELSTGWVNWD